MYFLSDSMCMLIRKHPPHRNDLPALLQDPRLFGHLAQSANHLLIAFHKPEDGVRNPDLLAKLPHQPLRLAQIMPRDPRVQMVDGLELETAVDEVQPGWAIDVHGRAEHFLGEGLVGAEVGGRHGEVGECDLDVQRRGDGVGDQDEDDAVPPGRDRGPDCVVAEPGPEEDLAGDLEVPVPVCGAFEGAGEEDQVRP